MLIRNLKSTDSLDELTALLHRAYKSLADLGLRYVATYQDVDVTRRRIGKGRCLVAEIDGKIVGTVLYHSPSQTQGSPWLDRDDVAHISQLGVDPAHQNRGIGGALIAAAEKLARDELVAEIALDTAVPAEHLIAWYGKLGFRFVEYTDWEMTNYQSVVMSKSLIE